MRRRIESLSVGGMVASTVLLAVLAFSGEAPPILESPIRLSRLQIPCILFFAFLALDTVLGSGRFGRFSRRIDQGPGELRDRFRVGAIVAMLVILGWALRWADLDKYGLSPDEAIFIYTSSGETVGDVLNNSLLNAHPPANFLTLHLLLKVSWGPVWIRLASLIGGTYLIWITYMFGRQWVGTTGGLLMAMLVTFSPTLILLSRVSRNYSPGDGAPRDRALFRRAIYPGGALAIFLLFRGIRIPCGHVALQFLDRDHRSESDVGCGSRASPAWVAMVDQGGPGAITAGVGFRSGILRASASDGNVSPKRIYG